MTEQNVVIVEHKARTLVLNNTVSTRKYPFTQQTLDQIQDLRAEAEERIYQAEGYEVMVPAPIVIAEAVDALHKQTFKQEQ